MKGQTIALTLLLAAGCGGSRPSGVVPNTTYFWHIISSEVSFGACSDEPGFRMQLRPLPITENSFEVYKVDADGKTAVEQKCLTDQASSCTPIPEKTFTVAYPELIFSTQIKSPVGDAGCSLLDTSTWTITDLGSTGTLEITHVLSLVDNPSACLAVDTAQQRNSPNMLGLEGCVVTFKLGLKLE